MAVRARHRGTEPVKQESSEQEVRPSETDEGDDRGSVHGPNSATSRTASTPGEKSVTSSWRYCNLDEMRSSLIVACAALLAGCGNGFDNEVRGEPIGGDVVGAYDTQAINPKYGVAVSTSSPDVAELDVQLGEAALNCSYYLRPGGGNPAGIFARVYLKKAA